MAYSCRHYAGDEDNWRIRAFLRQLTLDSGLRPATWHVARWPTGGRTASRTSNGTQAARATVVDGAERDRLWDQHVAALPHFAAYPEQTGRVIPMVRLTLLD